MTHLVDRPSVGEIAGLSDGPAYHRARHAQDGGVETVRLDEPGLKITRFRLLSDPGFPAWDVSYCHGVLDGRHVDVQLPWSQLPKQVTYTDRHGNKRKGGWKAFVVAECRKMGINAKRIGLLDNFSTLC